MNNKNYLNVETGKIYSAYKLGLNKNEEPTNDLWVEVIKKNGFWEVKN